MNRRWVFLLLGCTALSLSGCVGGVKLRHPTTGQEATCGPYALKYGIGYNELDRCLNDYQRQGYQRIAEGGGSAPAPATAATTPAPGSTPSQPGLSGTFSGDVTGTLRGQTFAMRVTFTLVQSGDQLVGTWTTTGGTSGTLQALVSGGTVSDFRARQVNPCEGTFAGAAVIEAQNSRLRGSYTGSDCQGPATASFVVSRQ